jgi:TonB family protein
MQSKLRRLNAPLTLCLAVIMSLAGLARAAGASPQPASATSVDAKLAAAQALFDQHQIEAAAAAFKEANEAAGGRCGQCLLGLARSLQRLGHLDTAIGTTREAVTALAGNPLQGRAYCQLGDQLLLGEVTATAAAEAEEMYGSALNAGAGYRAEALSGIAEARLQLDRYQQAIEAARDSLAVSRSGETAGRARSTICRAQRRGDLPSRAFLLRDAVPNAYRPTDEQDPLRVGGPVSKPVKVYAPPPVYTEEARKQRLQGVVIIEAVIDREGCISDDHILKGMPLGLSRAAVAAVEKWVFEPATLTGTPVKVWYTLTINFQVE